MAEQQGTPVRRSGGGPRLDILEWTVLLGLFERNGRERLGPRHPDILAASVSLSKLAAFRGHARGDTQLRSPDGLTRRLDVFRLLDQGAPVMAPSAASQVWERFRYQPEICVEIALNCIVEAATKEDMLPRYPGPRPWEGTVNHVRTIGKTSLYVMEFIGHDSGSYVKIGIASVVKRRLREVNQYFPPGLKLGWTIHLEIEFPNAFLAYLAEQRTLDDLRRCRRWIGREFASVDVEVAGDLATKNAREVIGHHDHSN